MTNFRTDPNGTDATDIRVGDVAEPGRLVGQVFNDIYFERDPQSPWYGEPRPIGDIPVGIYARVDTAGPDGNVNLPYDANNWRLFTTVTTSPDGSFEALLPSTETLNCPIPQGPCPGMYLVMVDDPGYEGAPERQLQPEPAHATTPAEVWPGLTDQLDLPLDPISGTGCEDPGRTGRGPSCCRSRQPVVRGDSRPAGGSRSRRDFIGTPGRPPAPPAASDPDRRRTGAHDPDPGQRRHRQLDARASGAPPDTIVIQVPAMSPTFPPGPKQLTLDHRERQRRRVDASTGSPSTSWARHGGVALQPDRRQRRRRRR